MHRNEDSASEKKSHKRKYEELMSDDIEVSEDETVEKDKRASKKRRTMAEKEADAREIAEQNPLVTTEFSSADVDKLSTNEYGRLLNPSKKIAHAVFFEGSDEALQFFIPPGEQKDTPLVRQLKDIERIERKGKEFFRARTPERETTMFATRFEDGEFDGKKFRIANFSPMPANSKYPEPYFGDPEKEVEIFRKHLDEEEQKDLDRELADIVKKGIKTKGGEEVVVDPQSVQLRDIIDSRGTQQNTVMGESAVNAFEAFMDNWEGYITPDAKKIFEQSIKAPLRNNFYGQYRPEWLHAAGHGLVPIDLDPQCEENLGAAPRWANTEMMILERIVKWYALHRLDAKTSIRPFFEMILDSEIIRKIDFEIKIEEFGHTFKLEQHIDPIKLHELFRKPTDIMQGTAIAYSMLNEVDPIRKEPIKQGGSVMTGRQTIPAKKKIFSKADESVDEKAEKTATEKPVARKSADKSVEKPAVKKSEDKIVAKKTTTPAVASKLPEDLPINLSTIKSWEKSVVRINVTAKEHNFSEPWVGSSQRTWRGSGFVVEHEGKKYICTNAHVAGGAVNMTARFANGKKRYQAKEIQIARHADLALLEIDNEEFQSLAVPVEIADMVQLEQAVQVVGFPKGGDQVYTSKGIVSRIEVDDYCESNLPMLQVGVDAAINGGNSGGPVFTDGKLAGVAFQGWPLQGLGFMIPSVVVKHFLTDCFSGRPYGGFPTLPVNFEQIENKRLRQYYGMTPEQTGVLIEKVDECEWSDAFKKLKKGDVLLEIDGMSVSNEGMIDVPGIGKNIDMIHATHRKFLGDTVNLKVLRKNTVTNKHEILDIAVLLDHVPGKTKKVPQLENHKPPVYFVASGFAFTTVTEGYLDARGSDLAELVDIESRRNIEDVTKKRPDDEFVVVDDVLDCEETMGYEDYINEIVKKVNGVEIHNIRDVVNAMTGWKGEEHILEFGGDKIAVIKNMSAKENAELFDKYDIRSDRSKDLQNLPVVDAMDIDEPVPQVKVKAPVAAIARPVPVRATTAKIMQMVAPPKAKEPSSEDELMPDYEPSDDESRVTHAGKKKLTIDDFTGVKHFRNAVDRIEQEARLLQDLGFEDDEIDVEALGEGSESSEDIEEESSVSEEKPRRHSSVARHHASAFSRKRKRDDEDEEDNAHDAKRHKGMFSKK